MFRNPQISLASGWIGLAREDLQFRIGSSPILSHFRFDDRQIIDRIDAQRLARLQHRQGPHLLALAPSGSPDSR